MSAVIARRMLIIGRRTGTTPAHMRIGGRRIGTTPARMRIVGPCAVTTRRRTTMSGITARLYTAIARRTVGTTRHRRSGAFALGPGVGTQVPE